MKAKIDKMAIIKYIATFVLLVVLRHSNQTVGQAFAFGLFFGCVFSGYNPYICGGMFIVSSLAFGVDSLIVSAIQTAIALVARIILVKVDFKYNKLMTIVTLILSQVYNVAMGELALLPTRLLVALGAIVFAFVSMFVARAIVIKNLKYKLQVDEIICLGAFSIVVCMGLCDINIAGVSLLNMFVAFAMLVVLSTFSGVAAFSVAAIAGIAYIIAGQGVNNLAIFVLWCLVAVCFLPLNRRISALAVVLADVCAGLFLSLYIDYTAFNLISALFGALAFSLISNRQIERLMDRYGINNDKFSARHIINRQRINLSRKLYDLSEIFFQMNLTFKSMVVGVLSADKAQVELAKNVSDQVCANCPERVKCWRVNVTETESTFIKLVTAALNRGKGTVLDLNSALTSRCGRIPTLLGAVNQAVANYKQYFTVTNNSDNSRLLIGEQLYGVSQIMNGLSQQSKVSLSYDTNKERQLIEELTYYNILVKEVVIFNEKDNVNITLVVLHSDANNINILSVASKVCNVKLMIQQIENTNNPNWVVLYLRPSPNFDVAFGFSCVKKQGSDISGDTHSFTRIDKDKFLLALCDGMGSGVDAEKASSTAISLVENFYRAGFDNELILSSVNRLLSTRNDEIFTAVDICVVDLMNGLCDFIKIGAPLGLVKSGNQTIFIESGSLPLGVLEEMKPTVTKRALNSNDIIVLLSDGVVDAFADKQALALALNDISLNNPQLIADTLMERALLCTNNVAKDDMTAIVARVYQIS